YLKREGLRGAYLYYDARTDDTRLTIEVIRSAVKAGAIVANYAKVTSLIREGSRVRGAVVQDQLEPHNPPFPVTADVVVNATGPWVDRIVALDDPHAEPQLRPSKGTHLVIPADRLPLKTAVLAFSPTGDGRFVFVVPWKGAVVLGTTDTPYDDPDTVKPDKDDEAYILDAVNATFPEARLTSADVISAFAGLRPLIKAEAGTTAQLSREHRIWTSSGGMINIAGGKLTTYRTMAAQVTDRVLRQLGRPHVPCTTHRIPLDTDRQEGIRLLERLYPELAVPLVPGLPHTKAEVAYAAREEFAVLPDDFLARRTRIALLDRQHGEPQREEVAELLRRFGRPEGAPPLAEKSRVHQAPHRSSSGPSG
ncbi:MAG TPA: glycerol-3-phosphate dehydrogenase/oxidase, partial [Symbiobacteriaceae bacterium]